MTREPATASVALLFPPFFFNDLRGPYLTLPQLAGFLGGQGIADVRIHDVNMRLWQRIATPAFLGQLLRSFTGQGGLGEEPTEPLRRRLLLRYLLQQPQALSSDVHAMRSFAGMIFDLMYSRLEKDIAHQVRTSGEGLRWQVLDEVISGTVAGLDDETRLVGITVPTADQLYPALALARAAKERFGSELHVCLGGSIFALISPPQMATVAAAPQVDSVVVHEGEWSLLGLYEHVHGQRPLAKVPNLVYHGSGGLEKTGIEQPPPLDACPPPHFPASLLAPYGPSPQLPVWASRGCYWGKCTFCDYVHLSANNNHAETIQVQHFVDVLEGLQEVHGTHRFEVITECLSPSFCRKLSTRLEQRSLDLEWTTHLKVEKQFDAETCRRMATSGCRQVTIGVESFNARQLAIMKKGCTPEDVLAMLGHLKRAGIFTGINIIVDFPSITRAEAEETLRVLETRRHLYGYANVFPFVLSRLTDIARDPAQFGIELRDEDSRQHNRGFHFTQFARTGGMGEEAAREMVYRYQRSNDLRGRLVVAERSLAALEEEDPDRLWARRQARFLPLRGEEGRECIEALGLAAPERGSRLVYDLDSKIVRAWPESMLELYHVLPEESVPVSALRRAVVGPAGEAEEELLWQVLRAAVNLGMLALDTAPVSEQVGAPLAGLRDEVAPPPDHGSVAVS